MRRLGAIAGVLVSSMVFLAGCSPHTQDVATIAEGTIYSVEFTKDGGGSWGFTRVDNRIMVPGGNGSWNVDAYGRLTRDFLIITRPQQGDLGPQVVPIERLVSIQFGDGGIKQVDENRSAPAQWMNGQPNPAPEG